MIVLRPRSSPPAPHRAPRPARRRPLVLLIDPDAASRDIASLLVRYYGYEVRSAPTAAEGLRLARSSTSARSRSATSRSSSAARCWATA